MAVFGVPRVHEDDAFRAAAAALEICTAPTGDGSSAGSATRVGLATGEVLTRGPARRARRLWASRSTAAGRARGRGRGRGGAARRRTPSAVRGMPPRVERAADGSADRLALAARWSREPPAGRDPLRAPAGGPRRRARPAPAGVRGRDPRARAAPAHDPRHGRDREVEAGAGVRRARRRARRPCSRAAACRTARGSRSGRCARWSASSRRSAARSCSSLAARRRRAARRAARGAIGAGGGRAPGGDLLGHPAAVRDDCRASGPWSSSSRTSTGRSPPSSIWSRTWLSAGAGPDSPPLPRPSRAARAATRVGRRQGQRELPVTGAPSRCGVRDADRHARCRPGPRPPGPGARDRRGKSALPGADPRAWSPRATAQARAPIPPTIAGASWRPASIGSARASGP